MKRAKFLDASNAQLSATQLALILVLFLGSLTDVVKAASLAPTNSQSTSGTPSMSMSISTSLSQSPSLSMSGSQSGSFSSSGSHSTSWSGTYSSSWTGTQSGSWSGTHSQSWTGTHSGSWTGTHSGSWTGTHSGSWTGSWTGTHSGSWTGSYSHTGSFTAPLTASFTGSTSITQQFSLSGSFSFGASQSNSLSISPSFGTSITSTVSPLKPGTTEAYTGQFPPGTPISVIKAAFCGNAYEDISLGEECDYGAMNIPKFSCCTPTCHFAKGGRPCAPRKTGCYHKGRCSKHGTCRGSLPKIFGKGCKLSGARGHCDGNGNCLPGRAPRRRGFYSFLRGKKLSLKKLLKKRNLKIREKYKNFNLDEIESRTQSQKDQALGNNLELDENIVDEIFDEEEISEEDDLEENNDEPEAEDTEDAEDEEEEESDENNGIALFQEEEN